MTQGFGVIRMKTIFRMLDVCGCVCVCVCVYVYESLGKAALVYLWVCVFECFCVCVFLCSVSHAALLGSPHCA